MTLYRNRKWHRNSELSKKMNNTDLFQKKNKEKKQLGMNAGVREG